MDRLTSLTAFCRVVETGGFSAAARRLNMSVTMVSTHVQTLEEHLGARLLHRTTRKVSLTEIGKAYYERSSQILADLDEADSLAGALQATPRGTLRLYTSTHIIRYLGPMIAEYMALHPDVTIDLSIGERMVDLVEEGFDLAIRTVPPPDSSLIVRRLTSWRHLLCGTPAYVESHPPLATPADLVHHNCLRYVFYPYGDDWRFQAPNGTVIAQRVTGTVVTTSGELLRSLALAGQGIFLAPSFIVADDLAAGRLVPLLPEYGTMTFAINALYPHRNHLSLKVRSIIDLLVQRFGEHEPWMNPAFRGAATEPA